MSGRIPGSHLVPQDTLAQVLPKLSKMGSEVGGDIRDPDGVRHTIFLLRLGRGLMTSAIIDLC